MANIKGKIIGFSTFKDAVTENGGRMSDIILVITRPTVTIKPGNVIFISNFPDNTARHLANMNGYHIIEEFSNRPDGVSTNIYLTEGRAENKGDANTTNLSTRDYNYPNQADYEINTDCFTVRKGAGITGWNKGVEYAQDWMKQADGKITECRRIYKWLKEEIIPTAEVLIKEVWNMGEFAGIADDLDRCMWSAEAAFNQCKGLQNTKNGYYGYSRGNSQFNDVTRRWEYVQALSNVYKAAAERMEGIEDVFKDKEKRTKDFLTRNKLEKLWQAGKTIGLVPLRGIMEIALEKNMLGIGYAYYMMKLQKPAEYEGLKVKWLRIGGNRTKFDQMVVKGGTKGGGATSNATGNGIRYYKADGAEGEVIKIQQGKGIAIAGAAQLAITAVNAPAGAAALPYTGSAATILEGAIAVINAANIKRKGTAPPEGDQNTPLAPDEIPTTPSGISAFYQNNKGFVWGTLAVLTVGSVALIFRKQIFKKK